jgi:hypothetical protein
MDLTFTEGGEVIGYCLIFVQANLAGVGADESLIEDASGKLIEMLIFNRAQHAGADFCRGGNGFERDAAQLALPAKIVPKRTQGGLRRAE